MLQSATSGNNAITSYLVPVIHRLQRRITRKRLADVGQVLTAQHLDELDREMALDEEDSMADDDATISDANEENLLPDLVIDGGHDAEEVARQTAFAGLEKGLWRFEVLDHPRPVARKGRIMQN